MSFEGSQVLQKIFSGQFKSEYNLDIRPIVQFVFGRIYYFGASLWLFHPEHSPCSFHVYV